MKNLAEELSIRDVAALHNGLLNALRFLSSHAPQKDVWMESEFQTVIGRQEAEELLDRLAPLLDAEMSRQKPIKDGLSNS